MPLAAIHSYFHARHISRVGRRKKSNGSGDLFRWIGKGELNVRVGAHYPLADASRAHDDLAGRRTTGKLLLIP